MLWLAIRGRRISASLLLFTTDFGSVTMQKNSFVIFAMCCFLAGCAAEYSAIYQSVDADSKWHEASWIILNNSDNEPPSYTVRDNQLYLMIQSARTDWSFRKVIHYPSWDRADVSRLLEQNRDIRKLMPVDWNNWLPKGYGDECKGQAGRKTTSSAGDR